MGLKFILLIPVLEIICFILFGDFFGFFPVLSSIIISGILGIYLLKSGIDPIKIKELALNPKDWIYKKIAGILLLIPGFVTDTIGILLLFKSLRYLLWDFIPHNTRNYFYDDKKNSKKEGIIEAEYKDLDEK